MQEFFAQAARGFCALIQHSCLSYLYSWVHLSIWERFACSPKGFSFQLVCKLTQILRIQKKRHLQYNNRSKTPKISPKFLPFRRVVLVVVRSGDEFTGNYKHFSANSKAGVLKTFRRAVEANGFSLEAGANKLDISQCFFAFCYASFQSESKEWNEMLRFSPGTATLLPFTPSHFS